MGKLIREKSTKVEAPQPKINWKEQLGEVKRGLSFTIDLKHWDSVRTYITRKGFAVQRETLENKKECKIWVI
jgi:hypothetical protein